MTTSQSTDTATAARIARVSTTTIRTWARIGAVAAVKTSGRWAIDAESLARRITLGRVMRAERTVLDLSAFRDGQATRNRALELISEGALIPGSRPGLWLAMSSDGTATYPVDTHEASCLCKGAVNVGRCYHIVAGLLLDGSAHVAA